MANEYTLTIDVAAPPDVVWQLVGDPVGVPRWFTKYVDATVDGDVRTLTSAEGAQLVERLLDRDEAARSYSYTVTAGPPLKHHWASFTVTPRDGGSTIVWHTRAEFVDPAIDTEERLAAAQSAGLANIKAICEAR